MNKGMSIIMMCGIFLCLCFGQVLAEQLTFRFINPAFGGHPSNYGWLLESANIQNEYEEDLLEDFEKNLNKSVLNALSRHIVNSAFGGYDEDLQAGQYQFGDYSIDISTGDGITVEIFDQGNGSSTTVTVPYY